MKINFVSLIKYQLYITRRHSRLYWFLFSSEISRILPEINKIWSFLIYFLRINLLFMHVRYQVNSEEHLRIVRLTGEEWGHAENIKTILSMIQVMQPSDF